MAIENSLLFKHSRIACTAASELGKMDWEPCLCPASRSPANEASASRRQFFRSLSSRDMFHSYRLKAHYQDWVFSINKRQPVTNFIVSQSDLFFAQLIHFQRCTTYFLRFCWRYWYWTSFSTDADQQNVSLVTVLTVKMSKLSPKFTMFV